MSTSAFDWNYPSLIAHRGAGKHAPENTLSAVRLGHQHGFTMMEYDVKLSRDGVAILLHDDRIDRTSNGQGLASQYSLADLMQFDFGSWLHEKYSAEPILTLSTMAAYTIAHGIHSNIEIKPETGFEAETGARVARIAQQLWQKASVPPLLSSFSEVALEAAKLAAPELPRALLIEDHVPADYLARLQRLDCVALNLDTKLTTKELVAETLAAGYQLCIWTVNDPQRAKELLSWGCKGIVTDAIDTISPLTPF
ncbi:MAG TPA: glycerophosphodiester phosphodiesterase [Alcaligenaceae bacterium]|nr:glycerophosphodiester phosphodiesterase [Alcaligenaceae bacterium]